MNNEKLHTDEEFVEHEKEIASGEVNCTPSIGQQI
jgi:hypothetical protein